ncbi:MAG: M23 family metallopeptidase [Chitinispirillaceae bacterium]|nr:M23 family metallopeptidase [Chitinispirillaceae bacterium]
MSKKTILIIPPEKGKLHFLHLHSWVGALLIVIIIIGVVGLFIPSSILTSNEAEQNQKKNLTEQNKALLQKVISTLRLIKELREEISSLEAKKEEIISKSNNLITTNRIIRASTIDFSILKSEELLQYLNKIEERFTLFIADTSTNNNIFDTIPVIYPVPSPPIISRYFGETVDPFSGKKKFHNGVDFIGETGTPVIATASGVVKSIEKHPLWGKKIVISHSSELSTLYAHLGEIKTTLGKKVKRGEIIGEIGLSGISSGPHLHYEILYKGKPIDPADFFFPSEVIAKTIEK